MSRQSLAAVWPPTAAVAASAGHKPMSPMQAIRRKCLDCSGGQIVEVKLCEAVTCALWPFRAGAASLHQNSRAGGHFRDTRSGVALRMPQSPLIRQLAPRRRVSGKRDHCCSTLGRTLMARPAHQPDDVQRRQVEALAGYGVPEAEIAGLVGIDAKTLRKHYRHELDHGHTKANAKVAENLYRKATGEGRESVTAAIFWLKTRARWKESIGQRDHP